MGGFQPHITKCSEGRKNKISLFFLGASETRSRIFRYGLPNDILSRGQKNKGVGVYSAPSPIPMDRVKKHLFVAFLEMISVSFKYNFFMIITIKNKSLHMTVISSFSV